ncbi:hypothetical protein P8Q88_12110 [Qipengyuania sp. XHP0207]|uniref:hypothetical protein n=1 Tax=Qipengyuania sp. XHP0207 TaxID=3038078 RepID=UPI0024201DEF|nr:hypothetical protein [Qipengyuania sp. XHP0207]MDG5748919.1 hypothetical protein [Qipengyuania sp. XHP0207]
MAETIKTPWHLWLVGIVSLLWNAIGAYDYTMTNLRDQAYLDSMGYPAEGIAYLEAFPIWAHSGWALGVWGAIIGSVLLLLRNRFAILAFGLSLIGLALTSLYEAMADIPPELAAIQPAWFPIVLWSIAVFLLIYAISMRQKGVLR